MDQANYLYDLMKSILSIKKKGANITGLTWWGLSDDVTWIDNATPLLFSKLGVAKYGYYRVLDAYTDSGYVVGGSGNSGGSNTGTPNGDYATLKDGWYYIKDSNSKKYLQVANNAGGDGVNVEIGTGAGSLGQRWYLTNSGNGYVTLKNGHGYMLDVRYGSLDDGANIQTYSSNGADAQKFKLLNTTTSGMYGIATKITNDQKSLDVFNFGTSDGTNVNQWTYYGNSCQKWTFEPYVEPSASGISNGWYYIKNTNSNK